VLRTVAKQAAELVVEKMEGIEVILNDDDLTDIQVITQIGIGASSVAEPGPEP
jgi:hypothetical protein